MRLRLRLKRKGNPPSVVCKTLTEDAVLSGIQHSDAWRRWLEWDNGGKPLDPKQPCTCTAALTWLGSDGKDIDAAADVEIDYWPQGTGSGERRVKSRPDGAREMGRAVRTTAPALADMVAKVVNESLGPISEAMALAKKHAETVDRMLAREATRVDSAIEDMADRAKSVQPAAASQGSGWSTLRDLIGIAKEAKSFLN